MIVKFARVEFGLPQKVFSRETFFIPLVLKGMYKLRYENIFLGQTEYYVAKFSVHSNHSNNDYLEKKTDFLIFNLNLYYCVERLELFLGK